MIWLISVFYSHTLQFKRFSIMFIWNSLLYEMLFKLLLYVSLFHFKGLYLINHMSYVFLIIVIFQKSYSYCGNVTISLPFITAFMESSLDELHSLIPGRICFIVSNEQDPYFLNVLYSGHMLHSDSFFPKIFYSISNSLIKVFPPATTLHF